MLSRDDRQLEVLFQCAQLYSSLGRYDEAATKYKRMLELDPSNKQLPSNSLNFFKGRQVRPSADIA